jgi:hypothetical protein
MLIKKFSRCTSTNETDEFRDLDFSSSDEDQKTDVISMSTCDIVTPKHKTPKRQKRSDL